MTDTTPPDAGSAVNPPDTAAPGNRRPNNVNRHNYNRSKTVTPTTGTEERSSQAPSRSLRCSVPRQREKAKRTLPVSSRAYINM